MTRLKTPPREAEAPVLALETFLPYRLARAAEHVSRRFATHYRSRHGLTRPEWRALATIGQFGRITATGIGSHSSMHKTKVSRAIRALEERKWLSRTADEADRRIEHLELTREGRRRYRELAGVARRFEAEFLALLGDEGADALDRGLTAIEKELADW